MARSADMTAAACRRCHEQAATITVRTEPLCWACFDKYVNTKVVKRMESFRPRNAGPAKQQKLLLALSLGPASVSLLHLLSEYQQRQIAKSNTTSFVLHVTHVTEPSHSALADKLMDQIMVRYPAHTYTVCALSDVLVKVPAVRDIFPSSSNLSQSSEDELTSSLNGLKSATARADVHEVLRTKLIVALAKEQTCEVILWADSTTRLAEKTLSETAKGRGFALPYLVNDGMSPLGVPYYYPMRELLTKEIITFAETTAPPLAFLSDGDSQVVSSRNATINTLMQQYFQSAEQEYPAIVSNVVRTTGKLQSDQLAAVEQQCELCEVPLRNDAPERSRLCYGCIRSLG